MPTTNDVPAIKTMELVSQPEGGGVSADAHVLTTFCGVETIEHLYGRVRKSGVVEMTGKNQRSMDVRALEIRTLSLNPRSGGFEPKRVTHLWRREVPPEHQWRIRCRDGSEITSSASHPFPVLTSSGIQDRRGDELRAGDVLVAPNASVREAWPVIERKVVGGLTVDEHLAWLAGYLLGVGSLTLFGHRTSRFEVLCLRLDGARETIDQAAAALARHGARVTPRINSRGRWSIVTTDRDFVPAFARVVEAVPGETGNPTLPEWVGKSPLSVMAAFLGGLVDSACTVSVSNRRVVLFTRGRRLARRLTSLLSALGFDPALRESVPKGSRAAEYLVRLATPTKNDELVAFMDGWVHDWSTGRRLTALRKRAPEASVASRSSAIEELQQAVGLDPGSLVEAGPVAGGWTVVESTESAPEPTDFYDFTVEDHNNYMAGGGSGKLVVIHGSGFAFSRIRPINDMSRGTIS